jgi:hypothetical protein
MAILESKFSREDVETLVEAMGDWETLGNHEFYLMQMVRQAPMPPEEESEAYEYFRNIKDHFAEREKEILATRLVRQERAVFLKAKLMLVRQEMSVNQLFEMATTSEVAKTETPKESLETLKKEAKPVLDMTVEPTVEPVEPSVDTPDDIPVAQRLEWAEWFIKDLGVWSHYDKFLEEKKVAK